MGIAASWRGKLSGGVEDSGSYGCRNRTPAQGLGWDWPRDTWFQARLYYLRARSFDDALRKHCNSVCSIRLVLLACACRTDDRPVVTEPYPAIIFSPQECGVGL